MIKEAIFKMTCKALAKEARSTLNSISSPDDAKKLVGNAIPVIKGIVSELFTPHEEDKKR